MTAPLTAEQIPMARNILRKLNLPENAVGSLTQILLRSLNFIAYKQDCDKCGGVIDGCKKLLAKYKDGEIITYYEPCAKAAEYKISVRTKRLIELANVPYIFRSKTAADFMQNGFGNANSKALDEAERAIFDNASLYIYGNPGTGKTYLASVIANERARQGKKSAFVNAPDILENLREFNQVNRPDELTRAEKLHMLYSAECLIIDDIGAEKPTQWTCEVLFKIINRRYNNGSQLIITSNLNIEELRDYLHCTAGDRIIRRICDMCEPVEIV